MSNQDYVDQSTIDFLENSIKPNQHLAEWLEEVDGFDGDGIGFEFNWDAWKGIESLFENNIEYFRGEIDSDEYLKNMQDIGNKYDSSQGSNDFDWLNNLPNYIWGSAGKDKITGSKKDDIIMGLGGPDKINGKDGDDYIEPGANAGEGFAKVKGGKGADTFAIGYYTKVVIKDFDIEKDFLLLDGGINNYEWEINGKNTYINSWDGSDWVVFKGKVDLSEAMFV